MVVQSDTLIRDVDPEAAAVTTADVILTWSQLERRARQLANALADEGIGGGAVWAVLLHNRAEWPEIVMGNARAGSRCMPLNWHLTPGELAELLVDSGAGLIVTEPALADTARAAAVAAGQWRRGATAASGIASSRSARSTRRGSTTPATHHRRSGPWVRRCSTPAARRAARRA